jgi:hypothetical protein
MGNRNDNLSPNHDDDHGLHAPERREYRGKESYEQQTRGGEGGRSGMWNHRHVPRDIDERYSSNADEDQRGYQNLGQRAEFVSENREAREPDVDEAEDVDDVDDEEDEDTEEDNRGRTH